ncbi:hypothetical protein KY313_00805 [Candidatus Woesearchaeota archaeon]|jgi:helicase|nr:hypothetical protein [Candidatus Woesearchaeota archaeon]
MVKQTLAESAIDLALETINMKKQALIFANTRMSAEKTAEDLAKKLKQPDNQELLELENKILNALSSPTKQCKRLSQCVKNGIAFHHSGLSPVQRDLIEEAFRSGSIKVICSTPTLAYGLDLPAFRVILKDLKRFTSRGLQYIPVLEYLQMSGRAGRPKYDTYGESIAIANAKKSKEEIEETYLNGEPETIYSKLAAEPVLRTYILSLIATDFTPTKNKLSDFFSKTLWAHHYGDMWELERIINKMLDLLEEWEFIKIEGDNDFSATNEDTELKATKLGKRVAELYLDPLTANYFITCLQTATSTNTEPFSYLQMISHTLELRPLLRVKVKNQDMIDAALVRYDDNLLEDYSTYEFMYDDYSEFLNSVKTGLFFNDWINEKNEEVLLEKFDIRPGEITMKKNRADWLLYTCSELSKLLGFHALLKDLQKLRLRLKYGAKEELLPLLKFKNIGCVRARKLYNNNIKNVASVKRSDFMKIAQLLGYNIAIDIKKQVGQDFSKLKVKSTKRKGQLSLNKY